MVLCGELAVEEAKDVPWDWLRNEWMNDCELIFISVILIVVENAVLAFPSFSRNWYYNV